MDETKTSTAEVRVRFPEVDSQGIVWHGNFVTYLEIGRLEWIRQILGDAVLKNLSNFKIAVESLQIKYHKPAVFDDLLTIKTKLINKKRLMLQLNQEIYCSDALLVTSEVILVFLDDQGNIRPIPLL